MNGKIAIRIVALWAFTLPALPAFAQSAKLQINLDHLAKQAVQSVKVDLSLSLLRLAAGFLSDQDEDEVHIKKLVQGLESLYVRSFEFDREGAYSPADLERLRKQLASPGWSCMVEVRSKKGGENVDVCLREEGGKVRGLAILAEEPKKLTVVNILGSIDLEQLRMLEGHLGVPRLGQEKKSEKPGKPKAEKEKEKEEEE